MSEHLEPTESHGDEKREPIATDEPTDPHDDEKREPVATEEPTDLPDDGKPEPTETGEPGEDLGRRMSIWQHLDEIRKRLLFSVIAWLVATGVAWYYLGPLMALIRAPAGDLVLHPREVMEGMVTLMKVAMTAGLVAVSPLLLYQVWAFVSPGLFVRERRWVARFFIPVALLFLVGVAFGYKVLSPLMIEVLVNYPKQYGMEPLISSDSLINFELFILLACGAVFQMPVITYALSRIGILSPQYLLSQWKFITIGLLIAAGVLTPSPDIVSQMALFAPMLLLYFISYFVALAAYPRQKL